MPTFVLEVVEFLTEREGDNGWLALGSKHNHVGYMCCEFASKKDACSYYDRHNTHMRALNAHGTYCSDWDPVTRLVYIVRQSYGILGTVPAFTENERVAVHRSISITESLLA